MTERFGKSLIRQTPQVPARRAEKLCTNLRSMAIIYHKIPQMQITKAATTNYSEIMRKSKVTIGEKHAAVSFQIGFKRIGFFFW